ncbi:MULTISPECIES: ribose-phosphate diphosphokinase [Fructobacillus]|jgi:ribose-phosphate pyrophosphokinase|uniref:Ribose-phosphate pyrophosphokinase n=4 Tax=Fructobacillus TaxID=559173 RepID=A0A3F3HGJ3_9LACO|nr:MULTISPECIES: ribose-phosphate diphosphokinase [Fructobacillus]CAK1244501.1 Phosphoribosylpyrophosphate synthetase (PrsA) [Fructobacillus sp. LMG 32999]MCK8627771.1 ribose-phosphate diphosphokinase [Fructobacillus cardui]NLS38164.1 ribose-phosphate diphosphokinase [Fructobacillus tropaeoli]USS91407.1 ribose-phosphate diphosphokinase [Fructobacillus americanaquae]CAK1240140.1 Phosphoribosylpyrophosphate synthetase (PrsA) [Fructobacillus cardui]
MTKSNLKLFSLSSNHPLAEKIAAEVGVPLSDISVKRFADGEVQINIEESVRGADVFVIQSTSQPVNDNLMELLIMIDALKRASADQINVVLPYYGYARQDRKARSREPITAKLVANMIERAGATRVMALDLHAAQIQGFFDLPMDHLQGAPLLADYLIETGIADKENAVVVSPDHGGMTRARNLNNMLGLEAPVAVIDKRRPKPNVAEVGSIVGDVAGKTAIMVDDMIDTAGTITQGAQLVLEHGAKEVYVAASHAVFSGPALERLQNSVFTKVIVTDSINLPDSKKFDKLEIVSVGELIGEAIRRVSLNEAISPMFKHRFRRRSSQED